MKYARLQTNQPLAVAFCEVADSPGDSPALPSLYEDAATAAAAASRDADLLRLTSLSAHTIDWEAIAATQRTSEAQILYATLTARPMIRHFLAGTGNFYSTESQVECIKTLQYLMQLKAEVKEVVGEMVSTSFAELVSQHHPWSVLEKMSPADLQHCRRWAARLIVHQGEEDYTEVLLPGGFADAPDRRQSSHAAAARSIASVSVKEPAPGHGHGHGYERKASIADVAAAAASRARGESGPGPGPRAGDAAAETSRSPPGPAAGPVVIRPRTTRKSTDNGASLPAGLLATGPAPVGPGQVLR